MKEPCECPVLLQAMLSIFNQDECYVEGLRLGVITLILDTSLVNFGRVN